MKMKRKTIESDYLKSIQRRHALWVNGLTFSGVGVAAFLWLQGQGPGWFELGLLFVMVTLTQIGIIVGYHRHFCHRSFSASPVLRQILGILGAMAAQGTPIFWTTLHRWHHDLSDKPGDPHSPFFRGNERLQGFRGFWHSYIGWTTIHEVANPHHYSPDLLKDRTLTKLNQFYLFWVALGLLIPMAVGGLFQESWTGVWQGLLWGGAVRIWITHNLVWSITSVAHILGHQSLRSGDRSTNNFWLAIPTFGESWHNNHHAFPNAAVVGWEWWQWDIAGWIILAFEKMGWVWDVKIPTDAMIAAKRMGGIHHES